MSWLVRFTALAMGVLFASPALAQIYPNRPIRLFVSFPPGGAADLVSRLVGQSLSTRLGQPVVVENRPGANGNIAGELAAKATPDGYTLLVAPSSLFSINPHLYAKMSVNPLKELLPVASLVSNGLVLTENPALKPTNFQNFIQYARQANPPLFYGSIGNGSEHHLAMELLKQEAGIQLVHVPYRGGAATALGVMGGEVAAAFGGGSVTPQVQSGQLRGLAVSQRKRSPILPDLPSISEFYPSYDVTIWQGLFVPMGTPLEIVARLRAETIAALAQPTLIDRIAAAGAGDPYITTPDEFLARIRDDDARYGRVIRDIKLHME
jgi:tripartite-type tricarboxylate transporter receptor subunit TctC